MKRAVEGERDRADRPVGAVDVKLAAYGEQARVDVGCRAVSGGMPPGVPESSKKSISPPAAHGLLVPSADQAGHAPASGVTMIQPFSMALSLAELPLGDEPHTPVGHVPYGRGALGDPDDQVAMAVEKAVGPRAGVGLQLAVAPAAVADAGCPLRGAGSAAKVRVIKPRVDLPELMPQSLLPGVLSPVRRR